MLRFLFSLFRADPKYRKEIRLAIVLLALGYLLLLALVYVNFNNYDQEVGYKGAAGHKDHLHYHTPVIAHMSQAFVQEDADEQY